MGTKRRFSRENMILSVAFFYLSQGWKRNGCKEARIQHPKKEYNNKDVIWAEGLCKLFGNKRALTNFNMTAGKGDVIGLVGPNGSGKSTAIKIFITLLHPTSGKATICGYDVEKQPLEVKRVIGYVPEKVAIWEELNAYENLYYWGRIRGMDEKTIRTQINILLKELGLDDDKRITSKFSKGMKQRVAIGMALLPAPEVIILDEPTSGLDPNGRLLIRELIQNLSKEGRTILLSTHEMLEAGKVCTQVIYIKNGIIRGTGNPIKEDIEQRYKELIG